MSARANESGKLFPTNAEGRKRLLTVYPDQLQPHKTYNFRLIAHLGTRRSTAQVTVKTLASDGLSVGTFF